MWNIENGFDWYTTERYRSNVHNTDESISPVALQSDQRDEHMEIISLTSRKSREDTIDRLIHYDVLDAALSKAIYRDLYDIDGSNSDF